MIEMSVFGADFVTMSIVVEILQEIIFKRRMMGVPISVPSYIYVDNMMVIHKDPHPESHLKNKSNSVCYHDVCESVAIGGSLTGHIGTNEKSFWLIHQDILWWKTQYRCVKLVI